ncbi:MAG: MetQ/NlpA family ABC transporter substrate-binding protein, partial [Clostridia bacterium]
MKKFLSLLLVFIVSLACFASCGNKLDPKVIKIGASPAPHKEILMQIKDELAKKGYTLEIVEYADFILPNKAVNDGDLDANYFQHLPYMEKFNVDNKTELVSVAAIHYEPYGIYAGKTKSLTNLKDGAVVLVPNDATNEARALLLLEQEGLIKLKANAGINATKSDIAE